MSVPRDSKVLLPCGSLMTRCWRETASNASSRRWLTCLHARNFGPRVSSRETLRTGVEGIGFAVKRGD